MSVRESGGQMENPFREENPFASSDPYSGGADDLGSGAYVPPVSGGAAADQISLDVNPFLDPTQVAGGAVSAAPADRGAYEGAYGSTSSSAGQRSSNIFGGPSVPPAAPVSAATGAYGANDPREQALNQKERELAQKEAELRKREADLAKRFPGENKNWPRCVSRRPPRCPADLSAQKVGVV